MTCKLHTVQEFKTLLMQLDIIIMYDKVRDGVLRKTFEWILVTPMKGFPLENCSILRVCAEEKLICESFLCKIFFRTMKVFSLESNLL